MAECLLAAQGLPVRVFVPGQPPEPISAELDGWRAAVAKLRTIYAVEWMIVKNYSLSDAEKLELVRDYVAGEKWGDFTYFEGISKAYLVDKPVSYTHLLELPTPKRLFIALNASRTGAASVTAEFCTASLSIPTKYVSARL